MLSTSPTRTPEYLLKLPPLDKIARPMATAQELNTEIMVSVEAIFMLPILFSSRAKITAKITMESVVSCIPKITPAAIPVSAEWPNASEKYAIFLFTIMVPSSPKRGVIIKMAKRAFRMKP